ncbi:hypothetical protein BD779DRAFT_1670726 [Infundibulicybe gibba]|nr:hypothetical protein BD779DRAFT_1670726 [Infundibulicybe gibba]
MDFLFVDDPSDDEVDIKFTTKDDEAACASFWELRSQRVSQASMLFRERGESPVSFEEEEQVITGNLFERSQREMFRDFPGSAPSSPPYSYYSPSSSNHSTPALHLSNHISLNLSLADPSQDPYFQDADAIICTRNSPPIEREPSPIPEQTSPITHSPDSFDVPSLGRLYRNAVATPLRS